LSSLRRIPQLYLFVLAALAACGDDPGLVLTAPAEAQVFVGEELLVTVEASPCSPGLHFQLAQSPAGLQAWVPGAPCRLELAWTPIPGQETQGQPLWLKVSAQDARGRQGLLRLPVFVWEPWEPSWDLPRSLVLEAGVAFSRRLTLQDPAAAALHLKMSGAPAWLTLTELAGGRFDLSGLPPKEASGQTFEPRFEASGEFAVKGELYEAWVLEASLLVLVLGPQGAP
jgi:hypothetical protein